MHDGQLVVLVMRLRVANRIPSDGSRNEIQPRDFIQLSVVITSTDHSTISQYLGIMIGTVQRDRENYPRALIGNIDTEFITSQATVDQRVRDESADSRSEALRESSLLHEIKGLEVLLTHSSTLMQL